MRSLRPITKRAGKGVSVAVAAVIGLAACAPSPANASSQLRVLGNSFESYYASARLSIAGDDLASTLKVRLAAPVTRVQAAGHLSAGPTSQSRPGCRVAGASAACPAVPPPDAGQPTSLKSFGLAASLGDGRDVFDVTVSRSLPGIHSIRAFGGGGDDRLRIGGSAPRCRRHGVGHPPSIACNIRLIGGAGDDRLTLAARFVARDHLLVELDGGPGDDTLQIDAATARSDLRALRISCGPGDDTLILPTGMSVEDATAGLKDFGVHSDTSSCEHMLTGASAASAPSAITARRREPPAPT
jgi:hypothetical protein